MKQNRSVLKFGEPVIVVRVYLDGFKYSELAELFRLEIISIFEYDSELIARGMDEWSRNMVLGAVIRVA